MGKSGVKDKVILYVKSEKISVVQYSGDVSGGRCVRYAPSSAQAATSTMHCYGQQDKEAIDLLEKAGIAHKLVDLSSHEFTTRLKARIAGLNETPTLIFYGRKIKGLENIRRLLQKVEA
jgi:glutaredoxin